MSPTTSDNERRSRFFDELERALVRSEGEGNIIGLTEDQIQQVATDQGVERLPSYYEEFLRRMGQQAGGLLLGTDAFYPQIIGLQRDAHDLLAQNNDVGLIPPRSIVFALHQGYMAYWFEPAESGDDDPPVCLYIEGRDGVAQRWDTFDQFLTDTYQNHLAYVERLGRETNS